MITKNYSIITALTTMLQPHLERANLSGSRSFLVFENEIHFCSSKGNARDFNQDRMVFSQIENQGLRGKNVAVAALCDGMGGMADGEKAASLAISSFLAFIAFGHSDSGLLGFASKAACYANGEVYKLLRGAGGATLSAILYTSGGCVGVNVGDSRIYQVDDSELKILTQDDTIAGQIHSKREKTDSWLDPLSGDNRLIQYIGMGEGIEPHTLKLLKFSGEHHNSSWLMTSDGAHYLGSAMLSQLIKNSGRKDEIPKRIVTTADWLSGHDNSSVMLLPPSLRIEDSNPSSQETMIKLFTISDETTFIISRQSTDLPSRNVLDVNPVPNQLSINHGVTRKEDIPPKSPEPRKARKKKQRTTKKPEQRKKTSQETVSFDLVSMDENQNDKVK